MKRDALLHSAITILILGLFLCIPFTSVGQETEIIEIQVSPSTLNIQNNGQVVTVHTDIAYSLVQAELVTLNDIEIDHWKADDQGNFVAKFVMTAITGLPLQYGEYNELTLKGVMTDGTHFEGTDQVMVINVIPQGNGKK